MVFLYLISKGCENTEKSLEQLKQEYEKNTVLLEREKRKMQRLKNRQAYLESGSRKQRTHRLITRGAAVESIAPQTCWAAAWKNSLGVRVQLLSSVLRLVTAVSVPSAACLGA